MKVNLQFEWVVAAIGIGIVCICYIKYTSVYKPDMSAPIPTKLMYQIPRDEIPELEPILYDTLPLFDPIYALNLTEDYFVNDTWDKELQEQCKDVYISQEMRDFLSVYEEDSVPAKRKYTAWKYKQTALHIIKTNSNSWILADGKLYHERYYSNDPELFKYKLYADIKLTGLFYYPPGGYTKWHTNRFDPIGWRMYYIDAVEPNQSWLGYMDNKSGNFHKLMDKSGYYNVFRVNNTLEDALWHCVYSNTHRFSVGIKVPDYFAHHVIHRSKHL